MAEIEIQKLNYKLFDRQMMIFCLSLEMFIEGYNDYSSTELTNDIHSLCFKASRLCFMADQDLTTQQEELINNRFSENNLYQDRLADIIFNRFNQMIMSVIKNYKEKTPFCGIKLPRFEGQFGDILPHISKYIFNKDEAKNMEDICEAAKITQEAIEKEKKTTKHQGETDVLRFWNLCRLYALTCYLYYHFKHLNEINTEEISQDELERLFGIAINNYRDSDEGRRKRETFVGLLRFQNNGISLTKEQLKQKGKELVNIISQNLQLCYINHRNEPQKMASEILRIKPTPEEMETLAEAIVKWDILKSMIYEIDNPTKVKRIPNTIFREEISGIPVDLKLIREKISKMEERLTSKNQWFCIWCVLRHHNLLADKHFEAFATQMMSDEWFPKTYYPFKGDNLSDYTSYFSETDFTLWDLERFQTYRDTHFKSKKKLSDALFTKFSKLCYEFNEIFEDD